MRLPAPAVATAVDEDEPTPAMKELFNVAGLVPRLASFGQAMQQHERLAMAQVLVSYGCAVLYNGLKGMVMGESVDQGHYVLHDLGGRARSARLRGALHGQRPLIVLRPGMLSWNDWSCVYWAFRSSV
ncbi:hypothetical protein ACVIVC_000843 [Sinorhizobium meliloti]|nr:hypothetical protein [Sinorhizobium meliloti]